MKKILFGFIIFLLTVFISIKIFAVGFGLEIIGDNKVEINKTTKLEADFVSRGDMRR